ncbi:MAG: hypothetical protein SGI90_09135 [Candidatus Eisenbacteria bacterium]|nr:hypothetical protein [Candidatus Eisenbacteria bacterium]
MKRMQFVPVLAILLSSSWAVLAGCGGSGQSNSQKTTGGSPAKQEKPATTAEAPHDHAAHGHADHEEAGKGDSHHHDASSDHGGMPSTLPGIWAEVEEERGKLGNVIAAGQLDKVHVIAFRVRDLVGAMPHHSGNHLTGKDAPMNDAVTRVSQIAALLDQYGDAGDAPSTQAQKARFDQVLDYIKSLYPAGALVGS